MQSKQETKAEEQKSKIFDEGVKVGTSAIVGGAATGAAVSGGLAITGFSSTGVVAGSIAAGIQSMIGNVAAGSLFATCQATAMGGLAALGAPIAVGAGIGVLSYGIYKIFKKDGNDNKNDENDENNEKSTQDLDKKDPKDDDNFPEDNDKDHIVIQENNKDQVKKSLSNNIQSQQNDNSTLENNCNNQQEQQNNLKQIANHRNEIKNPYEQIQLKTQIIKQSIKFFNEQNQDNNQPLTQYKRKKNNLKNIKLIPDDDDETSLKQSSQKRRPKRIIIVNEGNEIPQEKKKIDRKELYQFQISNMNNVESESQHKNQVRRNRKTQIKQTYDDHWTDEQFQQMRNQQQNI